MEPLAHSVCGGCWSDTDIRYLALICITMGALFGLIVAFLWSIPVYAAFENRHKTRIFAWVPVAQDAKQVEPAPLRLVGEEGEAIEEAVRRRTRTRR